MIEVSLTPARFFVDRPNELMIQLTNIGRGPCTNIVLRLVWPRQIIQLQGPDRIEEARLDAGQSITKALRVRPKQTGTWQLTSSNFSYRDPAVNRSASPTCVWSSRWNCPRPCRLAQRPSPMDRRML